MEDSEIASLFGVSGEEQEREEYGRVQGGPGDEAEDGVGCEALAREEALV